MEAMRDVGVGRVVLISSGAVYGDQGEQPLKETTTPAPRSPYAVSKLAAEYYVRTIGALWGIETASLRVFNAYGPGQHLPPSHPPLIPNFLRQGLLSGSLVIHGDGNQTRDFVFVNDVVQGMIAAATAPSINQQVINIGSGEETSVRTIGQKALEITGETGELLFTPRNDPGVSRMCADLTLAKQKLNYTPRYDLNEGLRLTLEQDQRFSSLMK
jgi:UDP-glucose 4-epimerase